MAFGSTHHGGGSGSNCPRGICEVTPPTQVNFGLDLNIDVDVCIDHGNLNDDSWGVTKALIYQAGTQNQATINQSDTSQLAAIVQQGYQNGASITQSASNNYAFIYQGGNQNSATITQNLANAVGIIIQLGAGNTGTISQ